MLNWENSYSYIIAPIHQRNASQRIPKLLSPFYEKSIPWARGRSFPKFTVHVPRLMYCFQASLPDSRPPPVCLFPPKAPPISAPLQLVFTFTIPVSEPFGPIHLKTSRISLLNKADERP
mmetsp:Transcript_2912/g.3330  ORF Transcript_2912/g.3330 Transcript_2912/m.3330 type:complete len:119 (-) Transcript_2912:1551-1907(-)